ncbi:MAG TPA: hypothetical protein VHL11_24995 [Phototrophicaceae bacterium]|nr:hypothetical protein [Phototrophicaceae bacterium]
MTDSDKPKNPTTAERLAQAFEFDEDTLSANRQGQLTSDQRHRLITARNDGIIWTTTGVVGMAFTIVVARLLNLNFDCYSSAAILACAAFALLYGRTVSRRNRDLHDNRIAAVEGVIQLSLGSGKSHGLVIQDLYFSLNNQQFLALKNRDPYVIYYLSHTRRLLSIEWLGESNLMPEES